MFVMLSEKEMFDNSIKILSRLEEIDDINDEIVSNELLSLLGALAIAAGLVYVGYQVKNLRDPATRIADSIEDINDKLGEILLVVKNLAPIIKRVLERIELLVEEIRGIINKSAIDQAVSEMHNAIDYIKYYMRNEKVLKRAVKQGSLERLLFEITKSTNKINELGGYTGVLLSAPGLSMWVQGFTAQEKVYYEEAKSLGGDYEMASPYEHPVHTRNFAHFKRYFDKLEELAKIFQNGRSDAKYLEENKYYFSEYDYPTDTRTLIRKDPELKPGGAMYYRYYFLWQQDPKGLKTKVDWYFKVWWEEPRGSGKYKVLRDSKLDPVNGENDRKQLKSISAYTTFMERVELHLSLNAEALEHRDKILHHLTDPDNRPKLEAPNTSTEQVEQSPDSKVQSVLFGNKRRRTNVSKESSSEKIIKSSMI